MAYVCCRHESFLCKHLTSWKLQDRVQAADLELIRNLIFPPSPSCSRCGKLQTLRICIALKLPLFIMSNWLLEESQPVKEFCSITIGDYLLLQFILSQQPPSLCWTVIFIWFPGTVQKIQAMRQVFASLGKAPHVWARNQLCLVSQLTYTIAILCFRLEKKAKSLFN